MIIVTGGDGQLAKALKKVIPEAHYLSKLDCNITKKESIQDTVLKFNPKIVINCAAYTHVEMAEEDSSTAFLVNQIGPANLAEASENYDFLLIHISSDYVFSGDKRSPYLESDSCTPLSIYGQSKYAGELALKNGLGRSIIVRTSWLFSEYHHNFVTKVYELLKTNESLEIVYDQVGSPTYTEDLAYFIKKLTLIDIAHSSTTYHYSNEGLASWFDIALMINNFCGFKKDLRKIKSSEYTTKATRPQYSVLSKQKIKEEFGIVPPDWKKGLEKCLLKL